MNALVLIDADLAILGASPANYQDYARKIRQEYAWVAVEDYRHGRTKILEKMLSRRRIYHFLTHIRVTGTKKY